MNTPLRIFALASILVHGLIGVMPIAILSRMEYASTAGTEPLQVELHSDKHSQAQRTRQDTAPRATRASLIPPLKLPVDSSPTSASTESDDVELTRENFPAPDHPFEKTIATDSSPTTNADPESDAATSRQSIQERLTAQLARHFHYPWIARVRGWQGKVQLAFRVTPDGELQQIHVARGSGYAVLDDSALNSLKRIGKLAETRAWLEGHNLDIQIPVIYKLTEN